MNPIDVATARKTVIELSLVFSGLAAVTWLLIYFTVKIDTTVAIFHVSPQSVPTIINGISTVTSIALGFSVAFIGIIARELLTEDKYQPIKQYLIGKYLFVFPLLLLQLVISYIFLLIGSFQIALQFSFVGLVFAILWITAIFVLIEPIIKEQKRRTYNLTTN